MDKQTTNGKNKTAIPKELLDQLIAFNGGTEGLTGPEGLLQQLTGALLGLCPSQLCRYRWCLHTRAKEAPSVLCSMTASIGDRSAPFGPPPIKTHPCSLCTPQGAGERQCRAPQDHSEHGARNHDPSGKR